MAALQQCVGGLHLIQRESLVNVDPHKAYTRTDLFKTAYETDPRQLDYVNELASEFRRLGWPVVWTHVAYMDSGEDAGIWGTCTDTQDSLQNIKFNLSAASLMIDSTSITTRTLST